MPDRELICPHCRAMFVAFHTAKYCSLKCALDSRILVKAPDECWPWQGPVFQKDGYGKIIFRQEVETNAHLVAYQIHVGPIPEGMVVRHSCDNPICCNYVTHLLLGTPFDNSRDAVERNLVCHGVGHHSAKLKPDQIVQIRNLHSLGHSFSALARQFGCSDTNISRIISGRNWSRV